MARVRSETFPIDYNDPKPSRVVSGRHHCQPPPAWKHAVGTVWQCGECGLFAEVYRYTPKARYARPKRHMWWQPGIIKQRRYRRIYS